MPQDEDNVAIEQSPNAQPEPTPQRRGYEGYELEDPVEEPDADLNADPDPERSVGRSPSTLSDADPNADPPNDTDPNADPAEIARAQRGADGSGRRNAEPRDQFPL